MECWFVLYHFETSVIILSLRGVSTMELDVHFRDLPDLKDYRLKTNFLKNNMTRQIFFIN